MGNPKDKESDSGTTEASASTESAAKDARDACHTALDLIWERKARDAALARQVAVAIAREMAKAHAHYQALLNERSTAAMPTSLKMTSGTLGFKVMDPFDWTKDKTTRDGNYRVLISV